MTEQLANALAAAAVVGVEALALLGVAAWALAAQFHLGATGMITAEGVAGVLSLAAAWGMYAIAMRSLPDRTGD